MIEEKSGVFILDKREGVSSARAIAELKRKFFLRKIGHAGTLDPFATGILVCVVNKATKSAETFMRGTKRYTGTMKLGIVTDSDDITGTVIQQSTEIPSFKKIEEAVSHFVGTIQQTPPSISAIKVNGQRAYKMMRETGVAPELKSREVTVQQFEINPVSADEFSFDIICSCGTYIRSLARDIGTMLGCGGCVATLRRVGTAPFAIEQAKNIDEIVMNDLIAVDEFHKVIEIEEEVICHH